MTSRTKFTSTWKRMSRMFHFFTGRSYVEIGKKDEVMWRNCQAVFTVMGHDHGPKIPSYTLYDNYREIPKLRAHEERLARIGLKDPWIRNYSYLFMGRFAGDPWGSFKHMFRAGWKLGCGVAAAVIAVEESYMYWNYGHTHWGKKHH